MLPHLKSAALTATLAVAVALGGTGPAAAWGQREQDTLKGAVGALVLKVIIDDARRDRPPAVYQEPAPRPYDGYHHHDRDYDRGYDRGHGRKMAPAQSIYSTPLARAFNSYPASQRYQIQRQLAYWGYYRGRVDGSFGPGTYSAVVAYARDQGMARSLGSTAGAFGVYDGLIY